MKNSFTTVQGVIKDPNQNYSSNTEYKLNDYAGRTNSHLKEAIISNLYGTYRSDHLCEEKYLNIKNYLEPLDSKYFTLDNVKLFGLISKHGGIIISVNAKYSINQVCDQEMFTQLNNIRKEVYNRLLLDEEHQPMKSISSRFSL